jgi:translation initiation factor 1A
MVIKKGGKKGKKTKNNQQSEEVRPLPLKDLDQEYCQVNKLLGNCRLEGNCFDGKIRLGKIRGTMTRKKVWVGVGDLVLVSLRDFEDDKCDVILKYTPSEVKKLKKMGEIPDTVNINDPTLETKEDDIGIEFTNNDSEDEDEDDKKDIDIAAI